MGNDGADKRSDDDEAVIATAILAASDRMDAQKAAILKGHEETLDKARRAAASGRYHEAAEALEQVANAFRAVAWPAEAEYWERRARDSREAARLGERAARKGKGKRR